MVMALEEHRLRKVDALWMHAEATCKVVALWTGKSVGDSRTERENTVFGI